MKCSTCRGEGRIDATRNVDVRVPAGAHTGLRLLLPGEGDAGQPGAERGDLELVVRIAEHADFQRDGNNLVCAVPISFSQAARLISRHGRRARWGDVAGT